MVRVKVSTVQSLALVLGAGLLLGAAPAEARRDGPRWQASPALAQILAQARGQMSDAERARLRRDLSAAPRDGRRDGAAPRNGRGADRMTPQQRESLRRDMRDANRQLDRNPRRGGRNGNGSGNGDRRRDRR
jgi:hypothetical protein